MTYHHTEVVELVTDTYLHVSLAQKLLPPTGSKPRVPLYQEPDALTVFG